MYKARTHTTQHSQRTVLTNTRLILCVSSDSNSDRAVAYGRGMAPIATENGVEGDDEREEEEEEEEEGEEEEEEVEDEPRLKYQRMGGSVPSLLSTDAASSVAVAERMIALGTHDGAVHILDFLGNQVSFETLSLAAC